MTMPAANTAIPHPLEKRRACAFRWHAGSSITSGTGSSLSGIYRRYRIVSSVGGTCGTFAVLTNAGAFIAPSPFMLLTSFMPAIVAYNTDQ
jgi:hypothetical protein